MTIDYMSCSAGDVIRRSLALHPSLFAESVRNVGHIHGQAACTMVDGEAVRMSRRMAEQCRELAERIEAGDTLDGLDCGRTVIAFSVAARLNCLSHAIAKDILARG